MSEYAGAGGAGRRLAFGGVAGALAALAIAVSPQLGEATPPVARGDASVAPEASRFVSVRMYQDGQFTAKRESPASVGAALASLKPTYVSALLRFSAGEPVRGREVRGWNTVVEAVRAVSPNAQFSVELNAVEYPSANKVRRMMARVRSKIDLDGWLFDFYTPAARRMPKVTAAAVASAHANGEFLGGNAFGIAQNPRIPAGTDYIAVQDFGFNINLKAVRALAQRATIFFHLGNSPNLPNSDGCKFIETLSTAKRIAYIRMRAGQQAANSFRFAYPVFFPECERNRGQREATIFTYNAPRDDPMMDTIGALMDQYAPTAPTPIP